MFVNFFFISCLFFTHHYCNLDIREWSVLALRNLCDNNEKNQEFIKNLKAQKVVEVPEELHEQGIKVDVSQEGKLTFNKNG